MGLNKTKVGLNKTYFKNLLFFNVLIIIFKKGLTMAKLIKANGDLIIKKPENLVKARYKLSPLAIKFLSTIIANLKRSDDINEEYVIRVQDFKELTGQKTKRIYELIEEALEDLLKNPLKIPLDKEQTKFLMTNWVSSAIYDAGQVSFLVDKRLKPFLLEVKEKFLKYKLENILPLRSSYSIRLYEILKDWLEISKRYNNKAEKIIKVDELREMLEVPRSYPYGGTSGIKQRIIIKAQEELAKHTDLTFDFEEIKTGRKVTHIKFLVIDKSKKEKKKELRNNSQNKQEDYSKKNFSTFKKEILEKAQDKIIAIENNYYLLDKGLLTDLDGKILNKEDAWETWNRLYKNKDKVKIFEKEKLKDIEKERKEKVKQFELEQLKKEWLGVVLEDLHINGNFYTGQIVDIEDFKSINNFSVITKVKDKFYNIPNVSLNWLRSHAIIRDK